MFPFSWLQVYIPLLPAKEMSFIEAPMPFIIGIEAAKINLDEVPDDVTLVLIDKGMVKRNTYHPTLPNKEHKNLMARLRKATAYLWRGDEAMIDNADDAFNLVMAMEDETMQLDDNEIWDAFFEFNCSIMKNYTKYLTTPNADEMSTIQASHFFNFEGFLKARDGGKDDTFLRWFTSTSMFHTFIENRSFGKSEFDEEILFFDSVKKDRRSKRRPQIIGNWAPSKIVKAL